MIETKFKVGDLVYWRQEAVHFCDVVKPLLDKAKAKDYVSMGEQELYRLKPGRMQILEILVQQCYGGIQVHYDVRASDGSKIIRLTEPELTTELLGAADAVAGQVE
jgi:hypothetical protein